MIYFTSLLSSREGGRQPTPVSVSEGGFRVHHTPQLETDANLTRILAPAKQQTSGGSAEAVLEMCKGDGRKGMFSLNMYECLFWAITMKL